MLNYQRVINPVGYPSMSELLGIDSRPFAMQSIIETLTDPKKGAVPFCRTCARKMKGRERIMSLIGGI